VRRSAGFGCSADPVDPRTRALTARIGSVRACTPSMQSPTRELHRRTRRPRRVHPEDGLAHKKLWTLQG
jgi:hypothetical protein